MKYIFLSLFIFISVQVNSQSSVYHEFPDSNATWNFHNFNYCWFPQGSSTDDLYSYILSGDTVINGIVYHQLFTPFIQHNGNGQCSSMPIGYRGALREEVANKKVYYVKPLNTNEELLYDFNLAVGDTITGVLSAISNIPNTVISIDTILVGSDYHKRWLIDPYYIIYVIEGIGSTYGLIIQTPGNVPDLDGIVLDCHTVDMIPIYPSNSTSCNTITSIKYNKRNNADISIMPNPSNGAFIVELPSNHNWVTLNIADNQGKIVRQENVSTQSKVSFSLDISGLYLLRLVDNNGFTTTKKLIIQE
jgi:hypothetical protein